MRIEFNVTGSDRKALVTAMAEILNVKPKYLGVPSLKQRTGDGGTTTTSRKGKTGQLRWWR